MFPRVALGLPLLVLLATACASQTAEADDLADDPPCAAADGADWCATALVMVTGPDGQPVANLRVKGDGVSPETSGMPSLAQGRTDATGRVTLNWRLSAAPTNAPESAQLRLVALAGTAGPVTDSMYVWVKVHRIGGAFTTDTVHWALRPAR
ncbi:MAG: hypothetical protein HY275_09970 [Gemmatimonadetes bacterium]|nr:hypothetical protein [Gemmatimonadota bacterium]